MRVQASALQSMGTGLRQILVRDANYPRLAQSQTGRSHTISPLKGCFVQINVRKLAVVMVLALLSTATAQDTLPESTFEEAGPAENYADSPAIAVLVHHPFPDASDPLSVEYLDSGIDAYYQRYRHLDQDGVPGFDFPHTVFDGVVAIEGIPEGDGPYVATRDAYQQAYASRATVETPISMQLTHEQGGTEPIARDVVVRVNSTTDFTGEDLRLWVAIVEDPIHYEPPQALSNGVFVHPFVVRGVQELGPLDVGNSTFGRFQPVTGDGPKAWDMDQIRAVAWVQQGATDGLRFDAHEVVQAVMETSESSRSEATQKVVLMEMYSATWCDTCLFGDRVAEEMAEAYGVERDLELARIGYIREGPWALAIGVGLLAAVVVALPKLPGGKP